MTSKLEKVGVGAVIVGVLALLIFFPVLVFGAGYLGGLILKWIVGNAVVSGVNIILPQIEFTKDAIPFVCGVIAVFGSYFKSTLNAKKDD